MSNEMQWKIIHDEREALLADLEKLNDAQWKTASLCDAWNVQQVVAHLTSAASTNKLGAAKALAAAKGNFGAVIQAGVDAHSRGTPAQTLEAYKAVITEQNTPFTVQAMLGDIVVHGEDIRRPLGIKREYPIETLRTIADFYKNQGAPLGVKKRIDGLHLMATDVEWNHGEGPNIVSGPLLAQIMAMTGRAAFLDDLEGDGMPTYRERFTA